MAAPLSPSGRLDTITAKDLTPLVRKALGSATVVVIDWTSEQIHGGVGGAKGDTYLFRFTGQAQDGERTVPWSMVAKVLTVRSGEDSASTHYWKREAEAYRVGLFDHMSDGLRAAQCYGVVEYIDEACWVWMEDVREVLPRRWPLDHYHAVAMHFGQFHGRYLTGLPIPTYPWLSSDWLGKISGSFETLIPTLRSVMELPSVKQVYGEEAAQQLIKLWDARSSLLGALNGLPQTLSHLDSFRRNLLACRTSEGRDETVAIDWNFVGPAAIGVDLAICMVVGLMTAEIEASEIDRIERLLLDGYLEGLSEAGWNGDPRQVRLGYCCGLVLKDLELLRILTAFTDAEHLAGLQRFTGRALADYLPHTAETYRYVLRTAELAGQLTNL